MSISITTLSDEQRTRLTTRFMFVVVAAGGICLSAALIDLPYAKLDPLFAIILICTLGLGSRISIKIPKLKSHVAVSDTLIFLTLILYGGETAIALAAGEAFLSSLRFCSRRLTILFNAATMAISTTVVVMVLRLTGLYSTEQLRGAPGNLDDLLIALSVMAITQFVVNTALASIHDSIRSGESVTEIWKTRYLWTFITYLVGAIGAGALVQLIDHVGWGIILAAIPLIFFVFMTYRMYLRNVEMSVAEAESAAKYAREIEAGSAALAESEQRFRSAFTYAPIGIALVSPDGRWLKVNRSLCDILGYLPEELKEMFIKDVMFTEDIAPTKSRLDAVLEGRKMSDDTEQRFIHSSGRTVWTSWSVSSTTSGSGKTSDLIFQIQDITGRKLAEERLQHEASHDSLTGLPNRSHFMGRLTDALNRKVKLTDHDVSVLFIDLDRFKFVNDSLGHQVGDQLLVRIAERLKTCMRPNDLVARLGGDEFVIVVEGEHRLEEVTQIAERIQSSFDQPFEIRGNIIYSSASIGILNASDKHLRAEEMMRDADTAMYYAKRSGKARHEVFDENMHAEVRETLKLETDLRRAIKEEEIYVEYQPIFSLEDNTVTGLEALARWHHPELGEIAPDRFVLLAEEIGWIDSLCEQVLRRSCNELGDILRAHEGQPIKLSLNLSCRQFVSRGLVKKLLDVLEETGFPSNRLRLEITESVFLEHQERAVEMLHHLRSHDIEIDVDDFGTGYSNLGYLVTLPISNLKVDRSFITAMETDGPNQEIVRTIISLARNLGLAVTAEGIENERQLIALRDLYCDRGQGYHLAPPMGKNEVLAFLAAAENQPHIGSQSIHISEIPAIQ
ncbi:MAG: EAL domain-containing protein [Acidobacteria bacterium]|nr:EAL domain-containing protein [Acidobacteriota bacterium]